MKNKGFTLVELLITMAIFSITMVVASGLFVSAIRAQKTALTYQELLNQTSYTMEYMSRAIRMAKKDSGGICGPAKLNYQITHSGQGIEFKNYDGVCQEFFLDGSRLRESRGGVENYLTSDDFEVISFKIGPSESWDQDDDEQPRVTIFLDIQGKDENGPKMKIQTTVSQRDLDIQQ